MSDRDKKINKGTFTILGDISFSKNDYIKAFEYYVKAGNTDKLKFRGHYFANKGYLHYAAMYLNAAGCAHTDEKLWKLINGNFKKEKFFHTIEPCVKMGAKDELVNFGKTCLDNDQVLMAMIYYEAAGMEFPKDKLNKARLEQLIEDVNEYTANENPPGHAIKAYKIAGEYRKLLDLSLIYLQRGITSAAIEAYKISADEGLLPEKVLARYKQKAMPFANKHLLEGDFEEGMKVFKAIGIRPEKTELITCGNMCLLSEPAFKCKIFWNGMKALRMAGVTPSKKRIEEAADCYYENCMIFEAIEAYQAAENSEKLRLIIKEYSDKDSCDSLDWKIMEKAARAISKIEDKISKRKNR